MFKIIKINKNKEMMKGDLIQRPKYKLCCIRSNNGSWFQMQVGELGREGAQKKS